MNKIHGLRKDFTRHPNEPIVTWLLRCWDSGANSVLLKSREACQLDGIARDSAIDRGISTCQNQAFTLWKRMLLAVKERYPFKDDLMPEKRKWIDMEKGIRYMREYAVVEMLRSPTLIPNEPDQEYDPESGVHQICGVLSQGLHQKGMPVHLQHFMAEGKEDPL